MSKLRLEMAAKMKEAKNKRNKPPKLSIRDRLP